MQNTTAVPYTAGLFYIKDTDLKRYRNLPSQIAGAAKRVYEYRRPIAQAALSAIDLYTGSPLRATRRALRYIAQPQYEQRRRTVRSYRKQRRSYYSYRRRRYRRRSRYPNTFRRNRGYRRNSGFRYNFRTRRYSTRTKRLPYWQWLRQQRLTRRRRY